MNAAGNYGSQVSANLIGLGNANAAAQMAQADRTSGFIGDLIGAGGAVYSGGATAKGGK